MERVELLALDTFFHVFGTVTLDGWQVVADPQDLSGHRPRPRVISTDSLVDLGLNVLDPFAGDAFQQGVEYPLWYMSSLIMVYRVHCCFIAFSCSGLHVSSLRYWMTGVIQLSVLASASSIARHSASTSVTLGCLNHICMTDLWWLFFLVTDNLDKMSALLLSSLGMCSKGALLKRVMLFSAAWKYLCSRGSFTSKFLL